MLETQLKSGPKQAETTISLAHNVFLRHSTYKTPYMLNLDLAQFKAIP